MIFKLKIQEAIVKAVKILKANKIEEAWIVSKMLLANLLKIKKEELTINSEKELEQKMQEEYFKGICKVANGYPIQYLIHSKEFMKMSFYVDEEVLVPRADTEILVEETLKISKEKDKILDLCTGSGAIAISLLKYGKNCKIFASDISEKALEIAERNAKKLLDNSHSITFLQSNMFEKIEGKFDLIVSNPPYIRRAEIEKYSLKYEPKIALDGGEDGLDFYRIIINEAYNYLNENGKVIIEIGFDQKNDVEKLIEKSNKYTKIQCKKDLYENDRVIIFERR